MYGQDKAKMRMKALESMKKGAPSIELKPKMPEAPENEMMGDEGFVQMQVTPEEKEMIMSMREKGGVASMGEEAEEAEEIA